MMHGFLKRWLISGLGIEMHKVILGIVKDQKLRDFKDQWGMDRKFRSPNEKPNIYQFVGQNDVSASQHTVYVSYSFPARKQMPSDFMAAVTIHSGFRG